MKIHYTRRERESNMKRGDFTVSLAICAIESCCERWGWDRYGIALREKDGKVQAFIPTDKDLRDDDEWSLDLKYCPACGKKVRLVCYESTRGTYEWLRVKIEQEVPGEYRIEKVKK